MIYTQLIETGVSCVLHPVTYWTKTEAPIVWIRSSCINWVFINPNGISTNPCFEYRFDSIETWVQNSTLTVGSIYDLRVIE